MDLHHSFTFTVLDFLKALGVLLVAKAPGMAIALTPYPRTQRWWTKIAAVIEWFVTFEHKDAPGTRKPPFKRGKRPKPAVAPETLAGPQVTQPQAPRPGGTSGRMSWSSWACGVLSAVAVGAAVVLCAGCATGAPKPLDVATQTLTALERTDAAAVRSFEAFDADYQLVLADRPHGAQELQTYRKQRQPIEAAQLRMAAFIRSAEAIRGVVQVGQTARLSELQNLITQIADAAIVLQKAIVEVTR